MLENRQAYRRSFLYCEYDGNDAGYFVHYHLGVLARAFDNFREYLAGREAHKHQRDRLLRLGHISRRQAEILYMLLPNADSMVTVRDITGQLDITPTTAKHDLLGLIDLGLVSEIALNRQKHGYIRGPRFAASVDPLLDPSLFDFA